MESRETFQKKVQLFKNFQLGVVLVWLLQVLSVLRLHLCRVLLQVHMCEASRAATAH